jgi:hypothetical protein
MFHKQKPFGQERSLDYNFDLSRSFQKNAADKQGLRTKSAGNAGDIHQNFGI